MTTEALEALKDSIAHWERLKSGNRNIGETVGPEFCALCEKFYLGVRPYENICLGCPILESTGYKFCAGTPYKMIDDMVLNCGNEDINLDSNEFRAAASKELEFLKSILPK